MCRIHQPGLYLMKYLSIQSPEQVPGGIYRGNSQEMDYPPPCPQKTYLCRKYLFWQMTILTSYPFKSRPDLASMSQLYQINLSYQVIGQFTNLNNGLTLSKDTLIFSYIIKLFISTIVLRDLYGI